MSESDGATAAAPRPIGWSDLACAALLAAATVSYLAAFPLLFSSPDEPHMLNEARRVLAGEVMYREIFDLTTPGWQYFMAGVFGLFGTTLRVARTTVAVLHGIAVAAVFIACRQLGVRAWLAGAAGLAYLAVAQPVYPVASYHWLATTLSLLLLMLCIQMRGRARWAFAAGIVVGLIGAVHQQRGAALGAGVVAIVAVECWLAPRMTDKGGWRKGVRMLAALVGGSLAVILPLAVLTLASAGVQPVWQALIIFPLVRYPNANLLPWGGWLMSVPPPTVFARLLTYSPVSLIAAGAAALIHYRRGDLGVARRFLLLALFSLFSIASITYMPDLIHIALIVPVLLIVLATAVEWSLSVLPTRIDRALGWTAAAATITVCGWQLHHNLPGPLHPIIGTYASHFGSIPMAPRQQRFYAALDALLDQVPGRTLYRYPFSWYTYLLLGARNPTRFEYFLRGYHTDEEVEEILASLRAADVPYVVVDEDGLPPDDRIYSFIREHYERMSEPNMQGVVWRRRDRNNG